MSKNTTPKPMAHPARNRRRSKAARQATLNRKAARQVKYAIQGRVA